MQFSVTLFQGLRSDGLQVEYKLLEPANQLQLLLIGKKLLQPKLYSSNKRVSLSLGLSSSLFVVHFDQLSGCAFSTSFVSNDIRS